ncbi:MAG: hypothetical protein JXJ04_14645 [Spirochaetales bacterium]|nr:hypothetical protein [Spirochaetales bacterium]
MNYKASVIVLSGIICLLFFCSSCDFLMSFFPMSEGEYNLVTTLFNGEDFESGNFPGGWETSEESPWFVTGSTACSDSYSIRSGNIGDSDETYLEVKVNLNKGDTIRFCYKVSSESHYDYLIFYINDVSMDSWSGEKDWSTASFQIDDGGINTLKWKYNKDFSDSNGSDCAWIDNIERIPQ